MMHNKIGPWVDSEDFWDRESEIKNFTESLSGGESILLIAPRRVGKTSLVRETFRRLEAQGSPYYALVADVQNCATPEDVVVELSKATQKHQVLWRRTMDAFKSVLGTIMDKIESVGIETIELKLREGTAEAWQIRGDRVLEGLAQVDRPVVICIDELPVMLNRILRSGKGVAQADVFLSWLRRACLQHQGRIRFVVCGSIGLEPIVRQAGLSNTINHFRPFHLEPWSREVADGCLKQLAENYGLNLTSEVRSAMLDRLICFIPHHVQMFFGHVLDDCRRRGVNSASQRDVAQVYHRFMLGTRGHAELADYEERLRRVLGPERIPLALDLLTEAATTGWLTKKAMEVLLRCNAPQGEDAQSVLRGILEVLEHDGYLVPADEKGRTLKFASGLVRDWWKRMFGTGYVPAKKRKP